MTKGWLEMICGVIAALIGTLIGPMDNAFIVLFVLIISDIVIGVIDVVVFHKSKYGKKLKSDALFQGIIRKGLMLDLIILGAQVDRILNIGYARNGVIYYLIATEGLSIIENLGRAGVPLPKFLENLLDVMKDKADGGNEK